MINHTDMCVYYTYMYANACAHVTHMYVHTTHRHRHVHTRTDTNRHTHLQYLHKLEVFECPSLYCSDFIMVKVKVTQSAHFLKCILINALNFVVSSRTVKQ